ncbi:Gfo/Idh/MocA family oxidoreductase [Haemophilus haemoglobinophilus]|nr:Gfo/Idh/MocA family oxidoreductase [Canicola haemoglobinophilus]
MKLAIIGTGMIVHEFLQIKSQLPLKQCAIYGRDQEKVFKLLTEHGLSQAFTDYDELLNSEFDTFYIALPNHLHFSFAKQALQAGKNVILEKPITSNLAEFKELKQLAKTNQCFLLEAVTVHYLPAYIALKQEMAKLGEIKILSLNYSQYSSRYDRFKQGEILPAFDPQKSGGALMDLNVYNIHFAVGLFGKPKSCIYQANINKGIDTSGILLLNYGDFQACCIGAKDCQAPVILSIQGEQGCITVPMPANAMTEYALTFNKSETKQYHFDKPHRMLHEFLAFIEIIQQKDYQRANQMLEVSEIVCEITETARKQQGILFADE